MIIHGHYLHNKPTPTYKTWGDTLGVKYYTIARYIRLHGIEEALRFYGGVKAL